MEREECYAAWLSSVPGIGNRTVERLYHEFASFEAIYRAQEGALAKWLPPKRLESFLQSRKTDSPGQIAEHIQKRGVRFYTKNSISYPKRLAEIPDAPWFLYSIGTLPRDDLPSVAVIGARDCSAYGEIVATQLGRVLGQCGIQVISGMARGVDCTAQRAAVAVGGVSFAVLGSGVDICYPPQSRDLYDRLPQKGGVISAYPLQTVARAQNFPPRNRIVSGLADAIVVVEARERSGTLITVDMALEQGRDVYVVPGRITERLSDGCNRLLSQGASIVLSPEDFAERIWEQFGRTGLGAERTARKGGFADAAETVRTKSVTEEKPLGEGKLSREDERIYQALDVTPLSVEEVAGRIGGEEHLLEIHMRLVDLCSCGYVKQVSQGYFCRGEKLRDSFLA